METEIIKVQLDTDTNKPALVYDKEHKHQCEQDVTGLVLRIMKGRLRAYFNAKWHEDVEQWQVIDEAPKQEW